MPVGFPADPAGPIPFHCISEFTGKSKGDPVTDSVVLLKKQLCPRAGYLLSLFK
jgi:hypothetical protein